MAKKVRAPSISSGIADVSEQPHGGYHRPQNSLNQSRFTQPSTRQTTNGKNPTLIIKPSFGDNVTSRQEDNHEFPDDDHFAKKRKIQKSSSNTSSPRELIEVDDDEHKPDRVTSPFKSSQESLPPRNSQVSSASRRNADPNDSQNLFRDVETRMKPNSKRTKPRMNAFHTPQTSKTTDSRVVSSYFTRSDHQRLQQTRSSRSRENEVEKQVERQPKQQGQLHSMNIDEDDVIELSHVDAAREKERSETEQTEKGTGELVRPKSPIHERIPAATADRIGISSNEDPDTSIDELHGPATMGNTSPYHLPSNKRKVEVHPVERGEHHKNDVLVSPEPLERKSASDIPITGSTLGIKQESKTRKAAATKKRRNEVSSFMLNSLNLSHDRRLNDPNLVLTYDEKGKEFNIFSNGSLVSTKPKLAASNVNFCWYNHPYVRLRGPMIDNRVLNFDLKFINEENSQDFLPIVKKWNVYCYEKSK